MALYTPGAKPIHKVRTPSATSAANRCVLVEGWGRHASTAGPMLHHGTARMPPCLRTPHLRISACADQHLPPPPSLPPPNLQATIVPRGHALGMVSQVPEKDEYSVTRQQMLAQIDVCMGGKAAEELIFGAQWGGLLVL